MKACVEKNFPFLMDFFSKISIENVFCNLFDNLSKNFTATKGSFSVEIEQVLPIYFDTKNFDNKLYDTTKLLYS